MNLGNIVEFMAVAENESWPVGYVARGYVEKYCGKKSCLLADNMTWAAKLFWEDGIWRLGNNAKYAVPVVVRQIEPVSTLALQNVVRKSFIRRYKPWVR